MIKRVITVTIKQLKPLLSQVLRFSTELLWQCFIHVAHLHLQVSNFRNADRAAGGM